MMYSVRLRGVSTTDTCRREYFGSRGYSRNDKRMNGGTCSPTVD